MCRHLVLRPLAHGLVQGSGLLDLGTELSTERLRRAFSRRLRRRLLLAAAEQHNVRRVRQLVAAVAAARRRPRPPRRMAAPQLRRAERRTARGVVERRRRRLEVAQLAAVAVAVAVRDAEHVAARHVGVVRAAEGEVVAVAPGVVREGVLDGRVTEPHGGKRRARVLGEHRAVEREHPSLLSGVDRLSLLPAPLPLLLVGLLAVLLVSLGLLRVPATATLTLVRRALGV
jgi:hypothetical protein